MSFFNTTNEQGEALADYRRKAISQESLVLDYFKARPNMALSPSQVHAGLQLGDTPLTSIRRAITELTPMYLVKTEKKRKSIYGRPEYCWKFKDEQ
jgi:hypothetical protein